MPSSRLAPGIPEILALDSGSGVRLRIPDGWQVQISQPISADSLGREGGLTPRPKPGVDSPKIQYWAVDFVKKALRHSDLRVTNQTATISLNPDRKPPRLAISIATKGANRVIAVPVPELDLPLQVIPQSMVARGIVTDRQYPQFVLNSSWQGVVVETLSDGVRITAKDDSISIEASKRCGCQARGAAGRPAL